MDFEIGNILYIVITLVIVIVGLLGRKKKPASTGSESGETSGGGGFLENLEKAFTMGQENQAVADLRDYEEDLPVEVFKEEPATVSKPDGILAQYERLNKPKYQSIADIFQEGERMTEQMEVIEKEYEEGTDYFKVVKEFDAGTAVVYSAIINRIEY